MTPVVCGECRKRYDYEVDDFCPRCGAYNRPDQRSTARRVDGVNETGHAGSFVHSEVHKEKAVRKKFGLDKPTPPKQTRPPASRPRRDPFSHWQFDRERERRRTAPSPASGIGVLVWIVVMIQILRFCARM